MTEQHEIEPSRMWELWAGSVFKTYVPAPNTWLASTFTTDTPWGRRIADFMKAAEVEFELDLIRKLVRDGVEGDFCEFGVADGFGVERLWNAAQATGHRGHIYGFDGFEGLPPPGEFDPQGVWEEGEFNYGLEYVSQRLKVSERPQIKLIKGWFDQSVAQEPARSIKKISYAKIDGDLYESAIPCLDFLTDRLVDGALLYFDEFTFNPGTGETRAFIEWVQRTEGMFRFEFVALNQTNHTWFRVFRNG